MVQETMMNYGIRFIALIALTTASHCMRVSVYQVGVECVGCWPFYWLMPRRVNVPC